LASPAKPATPTAQVETDVGQPVEGGGSPDGSQTVPVWIIFKTRARRSGYFQTARTHVRHPLIRLPNVGVPDSGALDEFLDSLNGKNRAHLKTLMTENFQMLQNPRP
jgi:hypothetical protein